jgi:ElaB/YqjD/DUF883 family membrane-anchored ribosome-binding protein
MRLSAAQSERAADVERLLSDLERRVTRLSTSASRAVPGAGDAIAVALSEIADRFRGRARAAGNEAAHLGDDMVKLSNEALRKVTREVEQRPLVMLAIAVGVGALAAGLLARR